ncbi:uncharacterized protein A4U43_C08F36250 [Asparagus officinalis]|nr:uncharacterized protein A4U43_C08F36250 [Asparagus officinalis]
MAKRSAGGGMPGSGDQEGREGGDGDEVEAVRRRTRRGSGRGERVSVEAGRSGASKREPPEEVGGGGGLPSILSYNRAQKRRSRVTRLPSSTVKANEVKDWKRKEHNVVSIPLVEGNMAR